MMGDETPNDIKEEILFFEGLRHGISLNRVEESPYKLTICSICNKILWNPQECGHKTCKSVFCSKCLESHLAKDDKCPKCNDIPKFEPADTVSVHMLYPLKFRCEHYPECQMKDLNYEDLPYHICDFDQLSCPINDCNWKGDRKKLVEHTAICPFQVIVCPNNKHGCLHEITKGNLQDHLGICNYQEIVCPSKCGTKGMKLFIEEHLHTSCPNYKLECQYTDRGCSSVPQRQYFEEHVKFCGFKPIDLECGHTVN